MSFTSAQEHLQAKAEELEAEFDLADDRIHLLELEFRTPLMVSRHKTDVPVPGLPNLDGTLQYAAFYWCAHACAAEHPEWATHYLWQVNEAFEGRGWIDFPVPLRSVPIDHPGKDQQRLYDCSVGLPVDPSSGTTCYPVGSELLRQDGPPLKRVVDSLPLRRRVPHPQEVYKPVYLTRQLDTSRGATKALDNRMYTLVVNAYRFLFRGDAKWVERLLKHLQDDGVGLGKKAALGYGRIANVRISPAGTDSKATLGYLLNEDQKQTLGVDVGTSVIALLKNVPSDVLFGWCADGKHTKELLGSPSVKVLSIIPALSGYTPPYWLKSRQALVAQYGSLLYGQP
ncbi:MAG: hypothetical protein FJZ88_08600 [Chloroflexi bacterium]|nr:hypothetical protein [Chloroflexota bacterium]